MSFEIDRRNLLRTGAVLGAAVALEGCRKDSGDTTKGKAPAASTMTNGAEKGAPLEVLTAVAERILPSDGKGPGAREANAAGFLARALEDVRLAHLKPLLQRGAAFLDEAARVETAKLPEPASGFSALSEEKQDDLLERLAGRKMRPSGFDGTAFVRIMVALTLEGFLGDPKHGGNKDRVAWAWLGFDPNGRNAVAHASADKPTSSAAARGSAPGDAAGGGERP